MVVVAPAVSSEKGLVSVVSEEVNADKDPVVMDFASFLSKDMSDHPERITLIPETSIAEAMELTKDVVAE